MPWFKKSADNGDKDKTSDESISSVLIQKLANDDPHIIANIKKLILGKGPTFLPYLLENLNHPSSNIRANCAEIIGELGGPSEVDPLIRALINDYHIDVVCALENALQNILQTFARKEFRPGIDKQTHDLVFRPLKRAIATPGDPSKERVVIDLLLSIEDEAVSDLLLELFIESSIKVRERIKNAISKCNDDLKVMVIRHAFASNNNDLHRAFLEVLAKFKVPRLMKTIIYEDGVFDRLSIPNREYITRSPIIEILFKESGSLDINTRLKIVKLAARLSGAKALSILFDRLDDPSIEIRMQAAIGLGDLGEKKAYNKLLTALEDPDETVVFHVLNSLVRLKYPEIITLLNRYSTVHPQIRALAIAEISRLSDDGYNRVLKRMSSEEKNRMGRLLKEINPYFITSLQEDLKSESVDTRTRSLQIISELSYAETLLPDIIYLILDPEKKVRAHAISIVGKITHPKITDILLKALSDPDPRVRANAVEMLDGSDYKKISPTIERLLTDKNNRIRANATMVLYRFEPQKAQEYIKDMLNHPKENMILSALWLVGELKLRSADIVALAIQLSRDRFRQKVKKSALQTLNQLRAKEDEL